MNLKRITLSERGPTWKVAYAIIPFLWHSGEDQTRESEQPCAFRGQGMDKQKSNLWKDWNVPYLDDGNGPSDVHLKKWLQKNLQP